MKAASVAADATSLIATTVECLASPATYLVEVTRTMDLTVTVTPDPAHARPGQKPIWPLVGDHYVITVTYPAPPGQEGGTSYALAGPMPGDHTMPIVVTFADIPAGGQCEVTASIYSASDWMAGRWVSGWFSASPDPVSSQLSAGGAITESLVPLTASTEYSQKQRITYDAATQRHIWQVTRFTIDASLASDLDTGRVSDALRSAFQANGNTLSPVGQVTLQVSKRGSDWSVIDAGTGITFHVTLVQIYNSDNDPLFELRVQNTTDPSPQLPPVLSDCTSGGDNHNICKRVAMTLNDRQYALGYSWQASGQNLPLDDNTVKSNGQMYAMQSVSTLGEPEDQIIEPSRGFSQQALLAFDQFCISPLFALSPASGYQAELDSGGKLPPDVAAAFSGYSLPAGVRVSPVTPGTEWTIGVPGQDPLYDLRLAAELRGSATVAVISVYSYPVPAVDNYYLDPRTYGSDQHYHLRGVTFPPGRSTFDDTAQQSWGAFIGTQLDDMAVHPGGYAAGVDYTHHKLMVLRLPATAVPDADAPIAMALSGEGVREGLLRQPVAMTVTADGRILILEQGNKRVQAFDVKGNPVPCFTGTIAFKLPESFAASLNAREASTALVQQFQQNVTPARAPLFSGDAGAAAALDRGLMDASLTQAFRQYGYTLPEDDSQISVSVTRAGLLWLVQDLAGNVTYDLRLTTDGEGNQDLDVYYSFALNIAVNAAGRQWTVSDATNAMTFGVGKPATGDLDVVQLVATMPLRAQQGTIACQDIAVEAKGYIYVLAAVTPAGGSAQYQLDIYQPDGTPLLTAPQTGVNAAKLAVDQWRTLFTMNYDRVLGPGARTEPGVSAWIPSTPLSPSGS